MMWRSERKRLFEIVCERIKETGDRSKARIAERIAIETGINKTHVYRYFGGKTVPNPETAAKLIRILLKLGDYRTVMEILEPADMRILRVSRNFHRWKAALINDGIVRF